MTVFITLGEFIFFGVLALMTVIWFIKGVRRFFKQTFCFHKNYHETSACDAVCNRCGKNLGFIGTVRGDR
jgi:hypothetical protein